MSKERNNRREAMKKPAMTLKEKRAAKRARKGGHSTLLTTEKK